MAPILRDHKRGLLIAVEGGDRCGKTTQVAHILSLFARSNLAAMSVKFPDRSTDIGRVINEYLSQGCQLPDQSVHLLFSANRWELEDKLVGALESGQSIVCDRYVPSGIVYSVAKGMDFKWCAAPDSGLPKPDIVIFLDAPVESTAEREGFGQERYEKIDFQRRVRNGFLKMMDDSWITIDASRSIDQVSLEISNKLLPRLSQADAHLNFYSF